MTRKLSTFAIAYDFDGTLAPGNMQEYDFVPAIGMKSKRFWKEVRELTKKHANHPVDRWRNAFASIKVQLDEIDVL